MIFTLLITIVTMAGQWMVYQKMGRKGWEGIIPFYNWYVLCEVLYNNGNKFWFLLIPGYNIYVLIVYMIELAKRFHKSAGFGVGLALVAPVFMCILGFGGAVYLDGSEAIEGDDPISQALNKVEDTVQNASKGDQAQDVPQPRPARNANAVDAADQIKKFKELLDSGAITQEEYDEKKRQLLGL